MKRWDRSRHTHLNPPPHSPTRATHVGAQAPLVAEAVVPCLPVARGGTHPVPGAGKTLPPAAYQSGPVPRLTLDPEILASPCPTFSSTRLSMHLSSDAAMREKRVPPRRRIRRAPLRPADAV